MNSFALEQSHDKPAFTEGYMVCNLVVARSDPERDMAKTWSWASSSQIWSIFPQTKISVVYCMH